MHHWNYLFIILVFPLLASGAMVLPSILTNKKSLFLLIPFAEIFLFYKIACILLPWENNSLTGIVKYFLSGSNVIHLPVVFIPALIFSILSAYVASGYVTRFYEALARKSKMEAQKLYVTLSKLEENKKDVYEQTIVLHYEVNDANKKANEYLFESIDKSCYTVPFENNFPDFDFDEETCSLVLAVPQAISESDEDALSFVETDEDEFGEDEFEEADIYNTVSVASN